MLARKIDRENLFLSHFSETAGPAIYFKLAYLIAYGRRYLADSADKIAFRYKSETSSRHPMESMGESSHPYAIK